MRAEVPRLHREIDTANGNLFDISTFYTALLPAHAMVDGIKEAGYRGFEWHPLRFPILSGAQMNSGLISEGVKDAVVSLHQSYRSEKSLGEALHHPNRALAVVSYLVLPERVASLDDLERIQKGVGRELPVVLYPAREGEESGTERLFGEKTFQPLPEVMQQWGVATPEELIVATYERGNGFEVCEI